jgi:hypothetical protein
MGNEWGNIQATYLIAHLLLKDGPIGRIVVAAGQQGGQKYSTQGFVREVAERQATQLLQHRRHVTRLENHLKISKKQTNSK